MGNKAGGEIRKDDPITLPSSDNDNMSFELLSQKYTDQIEHRLSELNLIGLTQKLKDHNAIIAGSFVIQAILNEHQTSPRREDGEALSSEHCSDGQCLKVGSKVVLSPNYTQRDYRDVLEPGNIGIITRDKTTGRDVEPGEVRYRNPDDDYEVRFNGRYSWFRETALKPAPVDWPDSDIDIWVVGNVDKLNPFPTCSFWNFFSSKGYVQTNEWCPGTRWATNDDDDDYLMGYKRLEEYVRKILTFVSRKQIDKFHYITCGDKPYTPTVDFPRDSFQAEAININLGDTVFFLSYNCVTKHRRPHSWFRR